MSGEQQETDGTGCNIVDINTYSVLYSLVILMFDAENMEKWKTVNVLVVNRKQCKTGDDTWYHGVILKLVLLILISGISRFV